MGSRWSKVTSMFRSQPEEAGPVKQIEREILSLRNLAIEILRADPGAFFGGESVLVEPLDPGERFINQEVDFCSIGITGPGARQIMVSIEGMYYKLRPNLTVEAVKDFLLLRAKGWAEEEAANNLTWEEAIEHFLPRLAHDLQPGLVGIPWGDLMVRLVLDFPTLMLFVRDDHLQKWGHTTHEAMAHAIQNLRRPLGAISATPIPPELTPGFRAA